MEEVRVDMFAGYGRRFLMKISKRNLWLRLAYSLEGCYPKHVNLCTLFWRGLGQAVTWGIIGAVFPIWGPLVLLMWLAGKIIKSKPMGVIDDAIGYVRTSRIVGAGLNLKRKVCPIIEIEK